VRDPAAAARLARARASLTAISEAHNVPVENLITPDLVRRLCWSPPGETAIGDIDSVKEFLRAGSARPWQVELTAEPLAVALATEA
jgi:ribonuclease D